MDELFPSVFIHIPCFVQLVFSSCSESKFQPLYLFFIMRNDINFESALRMAIKSTDLETELPKCIECVADKLTITEEVFTEVDQKDDGFASIRFLHAFPPISQPTAANFCGHIFLFHDQTNDANIWRRTIQILSASGYCCVAPQLTDFVFDEEKILDFLLKLTSHVRADEIVLVASSMSGVYLIPFLSRGIQRMDTQIRVKALIAIGISDTHRLNVGELNENPMPCLIIRGALDTSIGLNAANKLKHLPNSRLYEIPEGKHLCHISHPIKFHKALCNFLTILSLASLKK